MSISRRSKTWAWSIGGIAILILLAIGLYLGFSRNSKPSQHLTARAKAPTTAPVEASADSGNEKPIHIAGAVEFGCRDIAVREISPTHFVVRSTQKKATGGFYPLLKVTGLAGKTVEIDLWGAPFNHWGHIVPVYGYLNNLADPAGFVSVDKPIVKDPADYKASRRMGDRPALPDTSGQHWHYFTKAWHEGGTLCLVQHFTQDTAYVTDRVPYTPAYNEAYLASIEHNPYAKVVLIGKSKQGRPLQLVQIPASASAEQLRTKPCVLIYAREHPDEQDSSWVAQGAIDFLISDNPKAALIRQKTTFLIIPLLDPDGAAEGVHENMANGFVPEQEHPASLAYATWFKNWVDNGGRIDVTFPLHNPPPFAAFNVACPMMEPEPECLAQCHALHALVRQQLMVAGYTVRNTPWGRNLLPQRLGGWVSICFGALVLPYEVNSLTPRRQLSLAELRRIGGIVTAAAEKYLISGSGHRLLADIDLIRRKRVAAWKTFGAAVSTDDPILAEEVVVAKRSRLLAETIKGK